MFSAFKEDVSIFLEELCMEKLTKEEQLTVAKRITRKLCIVNDMNWHELLQHEEYICKPEASWSFRNWIVFLLRLGMTEDQIFDTAQKRLNNTTARYVS